MQLKCIFAVCFALVCFSGCQERQPLSKSDRATRIAEEKSKQNPVQKGRYDCWELSPDGDKVTSPLYILSDEVYQFGEATGRYGFNHSGNTLVFTQGPLYQSGNPLVGTYTPQGTPTPAGGKTLETMIQIRRQADIDAGDTRVIMQCNCTVFKY
ncbi:MAG TPA: hypothetical protein VMR70_04870 [Flavisolibacter sp.]|nr:hypothetical protein [Flavisolibacter sp.]